MILDSGVDNTGYEPDDVKIKYRDNDVTRKEAEAHGDDIDDDDNSTCGWFGFRPKCIQCFNRPGGILLFLVIFVLAQSTAVNGLVYVIVTTLERRFNLPSTKSGAISSCYDFSVMIIILFVTYFGEKAHKPVCVGIGALLFSIGSFLFTLPHFLTEDYQYGVEVGEETCSSNRTEVDECLIDDSENVSRYYWFFVAAQVLHGVGASPLYTLGLAFLYNNTLPAMAALFVGIFQGAGMFAPAIGYICGGLFLSIYTDLRKADETDIDPTSPLWVGAWWLGFIITGSVALLVAIPLLAFPKSLPGAKRIERQRKNNAQQGSDFRQQDGVAGTFKDFPRALWNLLTNVPYMCICLATSAENFMVGCVAVFGPKFMESVFTLTAGEAALLTGLVVIPSSLGGCVLGGYVIKRFNWQYRGRIRFAIISLVIAWLLLPAVFIKCPGIKFAGVTVDYTGTTTLELGESNVTAVCNSGCSCTDDYDPVCASTNVMYYSACHAGCLQQDESDQSTEYTDCLCVPVSDGGFGGTVTKGKCFEECDSLAWFSVLVFFMLFFAMATIVPSVTGIFEVVDISQRTTALGLQSLFYRCLGTIPGPIVFGLLIDKSCMIWEDDCEGLRRCWLYENDQFALYLFLILIVFRTLSITFFTAAYFTYKPIVKADDDGDETKELPEKEIAMTTEVGNEGGKIENSKSPVNVQ